MKLFSIVLFAVLFMGCTVMAAPSTGQQLGQFGLGTLGGLAGAVVAVTAISEYAPQMESSFGKTAVVIGSLTVFDGLGAAAGILAAGKIWGIDGNIRNSFVGGLLGGLVSAFVEPVLYLIGIPEGWTEFFGMALLPILPALGATCGFNL
ncbi:hypothetical protein KKG90_12270 [Candidatus Bipolaricaulota bacterium]|nr:hypothetical protein [Candidatus Bipolaricaulota bacterium]